MILYKYLPPSRFDVLEQKWIRFSQPGDFNDPFEFRPTIQAVCSDEDRRAFVEADFDKLLEEQLAKFGALVTPEQREYMISQKARMPDLLQYVERMLIPTVSSTFDSFFNEKVGVLCLSEVRDSILMWGHYTDCHKGFVIGFDSNHSFFSTKRSVKDEFGSLFPVHYQKQRPQVTISDSAALPWWQTKSDQWAYEKEWRILRVLSDASHRINRPQFPACLFKFPPDAVREIIIGMRAAPEFVIQVEAIANGFPNAVLMKSCEDSNDYGFLMKPISNL